MEYNNIYEIGSVWQSLTSAIIVKIEKVENNNICYTVTSGNLDTLMKMPVEYFTKKFVRIDVPSDYNSNLDLTKSYLSHPISDAISSMVDSVACVQHLYSSKHLLDKDKNTTKSEEEKEKVTVKRGSLWVVDKNTTVKVSHIQSANGKNYVYYSDIESGIGDAEPEDDFVTRFKFLMDNDVGAIYEKRDDPSEWVQVVTCYSDSTCVNYHYHGGKFNGRDDENDITSFHKQYKLVTFYPSEVEIEDMRRRGISTEIKIGSHWTNGTFEVFITDIQGDTIYASDYRLGRLSTKAFPRDEFLRDYTEIKSDQVTVPSEVTWPGAIWYHTNGGVHIAITIKEENGSVWFVSSDNKELDLYWEMPLEGWIKTYRLYDGVNKPQCFPEGSFDEMLKETEDRYKRVMENNKIRFSRDYTEIKSDVEKNNPTNLKTDVTKLEDFGTGAKREDKSGKGRYDLIPGDIMNAVEDYAYKYWFVNGVTTVTATDVSESAYFDDWTDTEAYYEFICNMICHFFAPTKNSFTSDCGEITGEYSWNGFRVGLVTMRKALAKHYEDGAKIHGVDNWKKGLPVYGSERGGCFLDSMRRHTDQALAGMVDEPHAIAAIWNAFGAAWTLKHKPTSTVNSSEAEVKSKDRKQPDPTDVNSIRYGVDDVHVCAIWRSLTQGDIYINWNDVKRWLNTCDGREDYFVLLEDCASPIIRPEIMREIAIKFMSYALDQMRHLFLAYLEKRRFRENSPVHGFIMALINLNTYARYNMFALGLDNNIGKVLADLIDAEFNLVGINMFSAKVTDNTHNYLSLATYDPTEENKSSSLMNFNNKMIRKFAESARRFNSLASEKLRGYGFESCLQRLVDIIPIIS